MTLFFTTCIKKDSLPFFLPRKFLPVRETTGGTAPGNGAETGRVERRPFFVRLPLVLLAGLCLATGWTGPLLIPPLSRLAAGTELTHIPPLYSLSALLGPLPIVCTGAVLFLLIRTGAGQHLLKRLRSLRLDMESCLLLVVAVVPALFVFLVLAVLSFLGGGFRRRSFRA